MINTKILDANIPLLSVCIPAYNRSKLLRRALNSIVQNCEKSSHALEIVISDDSTNDDCMATAHEVLTSWDGRWLYHRNIPSLGMAKNWNAAICLSSGEKILILHDDDFLKAEGTQKILEILKTEANDYSAYLFGVDVVDAKEKVIKKQKFSSRIYLPPQQATEKVLFNSSFVRFPGIVVDRKTFVEIGYFNETIGEIADLDMWIRIFSKFGVFCIPTTVSAYTVHDGALTGKMFTLSTIQKLFTVFNNIEKSNLLPLEIVKRCRANFLHQFVLAGAFRKIKGLDFKEAKNIFGLTNHLDIDDSDVTLKWRLVKKIFSLFLS